MEKELLQRLPADLSGCAGGEAGVGTRRPETLLVVDDDRLARCDQQLLKGLGTGCEAASGRRWPIWLRIR